MSHFEDNLWDTVVDRYGGHLAGAEPVTASSRRRPRLLIGAAGGVAASAVAASLLVGAPSAPPAFAVTRQKDGAVLVKVNRLSGVAAANRKLAAMGVHVRVAAVTDGQPVPPACVAPGPGADGKQIIIRGMPAGEVTPTFAVPGRGPVAGDTGGTSAAGNSGTATPASGTTWYIVACPIDTAGGASGNTGAG